MYFYEKMIFSLNNSKDKEFTLDDLKDNIDLDSNFLKDNLYFPNLTESQVTRHFTRLSMLNYGVDSGIYPLGSCTMKYNPKLGEKLAQNDVFLNLHPYQDEKEIQGALRLMFELGEWLKEISGFDAITLMPAAGAHGESTGIKIIDAYHKKNGGFRPDILIPDSAHGTNPASSSLTGHRVIKLKTSQDGYLKYEDVKKFITPQTAAIMITSPNTLGIWEKDLPKIAKAIHDVGAFVYVDGANTNAWMGKIRIRELGVDVLQFNLHKTFATPHGGGGPGSGPVVVIDKLKDFLPYPVIDFDGEHYVFSKPRFTIGKVKAFYGNFLVMVKAMAYLLSLGKDGISKVSDKAVLNANYIKESLKDFYHLPYSTQTLHEFVLTDKYQRQYGVSTMDIAKRLLDYGIHPPTVYFPIMVKNAIMIEPTESEPKEELDRFIDAMIKIAEESKENPDIVKNAPHTTPVKRVDETRANRDLIVSG